jgi:hypothetical protein
MPKGRLCLCLGPIFFCLLDGCLTLHGQAEEYWNGNYRLVEELNPLGRWALEIHPLVFVTVLLCWIGFFSACILLLPKNLAMVCSFLVQMGHTLGSCSWAIRDHGWLACIPLLIASRLVLDWTWKERVATGTPGRFRELFSPQGLPPAASLLPAASSSPAPSDPPLSGAIQHPLQPAEVSERRPSRPAGP